MLIKGLKISEHNPAIAPLLEKCDFEPETL
jgi:hypothetical protein